MVYSSVGYCHCGEEIWIEYLWNGQQWIPRFQDEKHEEISHCPKCGRELEEDELDSL